MEAETVVCEFPLVERKARMIEGTSRQEGFYVGYLTKAERQDNPVFLSEPGRYTLIVHDIERSGIKSNNLEIVLRQPEGSDAEAWTVYREAGFQNITMSLLESRATESGLAVFRDVLTRFPKSRYAAYARAALVLCDYKQTEQRARRESDRAEWQDTLARTDGVSDLFEERHPLRARLLFVRAVCQARTGATDDAGRTLGDLKRDFQDGELAEEVKQAEVELLKKGGE